MKPSNLKNQTAATVTRTAGHHAALRRVFARSPAVPLPGVQPEADPGADPPGPALALQSARLADERLHQGAHLTALVVPEEMGENVCASPT